MELLQLPTRNLKTDKLSFYLYTIMRPDYPQKLFVDRRSGFELLMETLAMRSWVLV